MSALARPRYSPCIYCEYGRGTCKTPKFVVRSSPWQQMSFVTQVMRWMIRRGDLGNEFARVLS
jgi:hypothetical protein